MFAEAQSTLRSVTGPCKGSSWLERPIPVIPRIPLAREVALSVRSTIAPDKYTQAFLGCIQVASLSDAK